MRWFYVVPADLSHVGKAYIEAEVATDRVRSWWRDTIGPPLPEPVVRARYPEALAAWIRRDDTLAEREADLTSLDEELDGRWHLIQEMEL